MVPVNDIVTAVIGLVGTADKGDTNVLTLCKSAADDAAFGTQGTIPEALKAIRMQDSTAGSALVFVVKVKDATAEITGADIVGTISETGERTGLKLFETAGNKYGFEPMIYIAPRYSALDAVKQELIVITEKPRRWHISTRQTAGASPKLSSRAVRRVILPRSKRGRNSFSSRPYSQPGVQSGRRGAWGKIPHDAGVGLCGGIAGQGRFDRGLACVIL